MNVVDIFIAAVWFCGWSGLSVGQTGAALTLLLWECSCRRK